ncbi:MAG TPA: CoA transferase [Rhizobiales bacterium]|nr:formyl-coenzyme A transferase [bacterium BMS3Bbin10]HDO51842.1 CoA transferase [Hyphomicrobiales bacterium]
MPSDSPEGPLSPYRVLDLTRVRSGPTCVRQLADWGADVIKIEEPGGDDKGGMGGPRSGPDFQNLHRNKRSLTLNLKSKEGLEVFKKLAATADVIVENFRPGVKTRLGIDYDALKDLNKGLVYASISGFGQEGPYRDRPGFDQIAQGMGGLMSITGKPGEGPMRVGIPIADLCAGHFCAQAILMALLERERSGEGQWVQTSLLQAQAFMLDFQAARWLMDAEVPGQAGNNHPTSIPTGVFKTSDGYINIAVAGQPMWELLRDLLDDPQLDIADFADGAARSKNRDALNALIEARIMTDSSASWIEKMNAAGVPCGEINAIDEVFAMPQVLHLGLVWPGPSHERGETQYLGQPIIMSRAKAGLRTPPPARGEHDDEILESLGYGADEIGGLRARGVI